MSELENCCGTTCDKQKLISEFNNFKSKAHNQEILLLCLAEFLDVESFDDLIKAATELQIVKSAIEKENKSLKQQIENDCFFKQARQTEHENKQLKQQIAEMSELCLTNAELWKLQAAAALKGICEYGALVSTNGEASQGCKQFAIQYTKRIETGEIEIK